ncbi:MAG: M14 family metallopeptidase [Breznakibacter sp.]
MTKISKPIKRIAIGSVIVVAVVIAIALISVYVAFNHYRPAMEPVAADSANLRYFQDDYNRCRAAFNASVADVRNTIPNTQVFILRVPSATDSALFTDGCYIPPQQPSRKLLVISSGVHGVEGFAGSAVQQMLMAEFVKTGKTRKIGVLMVHGMNPYGFKYIRRVTENNIDLNRNCDTSLIHLQTPNPGYKALNPMLNPTGKVDAHSAKNRWFVLVTMQKLLQKSIQTLRQAVLQGQYDYPEGLYFGGNAFEPQLALFANSIKDLTSGYDTLFCVDLHTGYGQRGMLHLFPNPTGNQIVKTQLERLFDGKTIDWGDSKDFYTMNGTFADYFAKLFPDKLCLPMMMEYGTMNSQSTIGSIVSLHNMVLENQGYRYGYGTGADSTTVKNRFVEMYYPSSSEWRSKIIADTRELMDKVLERYAEQEHPLPAGQTSAP